MNSPAPKLRGGDEKSEMSRGFNPNGKKMKNNGLKPNYLLN